MMTFSDYVSALNDIEKEEKILRRRIDYRVIQLLGKRVNTSFMLSHSMVPIYISKEERAILQNDLALIGLYDQLHRLNDRRCIVEDHAAYMDDVFVAVNEAIASGSNLGFCESDTCHCKED